MSKRMRTALIALFAVVMLVVLASYRIHYVMQGGGGILLGNSNQAFFFLDEVRRGYQVTLFEYPWEVFRQSLGGAAEPDEEKYSLLVVRVTPSAIEKYVLPAPGNEPGGSPSLFTPFEESIYANCQGVLCKWSGTRFDPATAEEQRRFNGISRLAPDAKMDFTGWYKRGVGQTSSPYHFSVDMGNGVAFLIKSSGVNRFGRGSVSVDLLRTGQAPDRIWYSDDHPRTVSKSQYWRDFQP